MNDEKVSRGYLQALATKMAEELESLRNVGTQTLPARPLVSPRDTQWGGGASSLTPKVRTQLTKNSDLLKPTVCQWQNWGFEPGQVAWAEVCCGGRGPLRQPVPGASHMGAPWPPGPPVEGKTAAEDGGLGQTGAAVCVGG